MNSVTVHRKRACRHKAIVVMRMISSLDCLHDVTSVTHAVLCFTCLHIILPAQLCFTID